MQNLPRKFNPGLNQDDKSLIEQYVVRLPLLKILLETIADNNQRPVCQHRLYYGPRGRGKTMLMARAAAELRVNPQFADHWIPIRLLEESYYEISNIGEFWLEVMSELALSLPTAYQQNANKSLQHLKQNWSHPNLEQMAQAAVLEQLDTINKKAVIMIENLHQLLDEINDDDFGWAIRRVMQNEPRIMFLVTATTRFDNLDNAQKPFFEIFATAELPPLKRRESAKLWNSLTQSDKTEQQIAPLDILTGGSPRLLNIVAQFAKKNSIRELMENLTGLVDEYTEYFKSQLDALAPKERRVFLALADLWSESSAKEISERARMDIRSTSALLGRLEHKGALKVNAETPKRKSYLIAERLFCIYYKLRRKRSQEAVVESLVQFMVDFYTEKEIDDFRSLHLGKESLTEVELFTLEKLSIAYQQAEAAHLAIENKIDPASPDFNKDLELISTQIEDGVSAYYNEQFDESISKWQSVIKQYGLREEPEVMAQVAKATFNLALAYDLQGQPDKAQNGYAQLIERYQNSEEPAIIEQVAKAMLYQALTYSQQGQPDKALDGYAQLIERYQGSVEPAIIEWVAKAMVNQAVTYGQQGQPDKALDGYALLIERYQNSEVSAIIGQVAKAMFNQAVTYGQQGQPDKALDGYAQLIERYQNSEEPAIIEQVANAMFRQALTYGQQGQPDKELDGYAQLIERYQGSVEPAIIEWVAKAMLNQALTYGQQGQPDKELDGYAQLIERYQNSVEPGIIELVAKAMLNQAVTYGQQGQPDKALDGYAQLIERYQNSVEAAIIEWVARAMLYQAVTYGQQGQPDKALDGYAQLIERYQNSVEPAIIEQVAKAMVNQAVIYGQQGQPDKELDGYAQLIERYQNSVEPAIIEWVATAMVNQAVTYGQQGQPDKALDGYAQLIERYQDSEEPAIIEQVATAMVNQSNQLAINKNWSQAQQSYQNALVYLENKKCPDQDIYTSTLSLGMLLSKQAQQFSSTLQSRLVKLVSHANQQSATEERMALAMGIGALLPTEQALSIIQESQGHEALQPLIVALQLEMGEKVRSAEEILEVAEDVRKRMKEINQSLLDYDESSDHD